MATRDLPPALPVGVRHVDLGPITGKGIWLTTWQHTMLDVPGIVAQAKAGGLRQLWMRTGGSRQGWYGARLLTELLPAAHAAGIAVVAWDFVDLSDPLADVERARAALTGTFGGQHIDAFSPDIETIEEGTFNSAPRPAVYLSRVADYAGAIPVVATVMPPFGNALQNYPYSDEAPYIDAFAPMDYWSCREPGTMAADSIHALAGMRPVFPIGQAYDMAPEGGRRGMPSGAEIWRFLDAAKHAGAGGASLYDAETARAQQWQALGQYPW